MNSQNLILSYQGHEIKCEKPLREIQQKEKKRGGGVIEPAQVL